MDPQASPPKRMTRARAAAKAADASSVKATKIVTAATKAKNARTATTSTKRKVRSEDLDQDEDDHDELNTEPQQTAMKATKATRGRPRKLAGEPSAPEPKPTVAPAKPARGRPAKKPAPEPTAPEPKPTRTTRTRKTLPENEASQAPAEPAKKPTRTRTATATKATAPKKTVKFEEPEKENVIPSAASKGKATAKPTDAATGLRARPVRRAAVTTRATRTAKAAKNDEEEQKKSATPLSPKKVTQIAVSRDVDSDDELGFVEMTPVKPLMKSPVKPPASTRTEDKTAEARSIEINEEPGSSRELPSIILGSPARRPPPSPMKDSMRSPARRLGPAAASLEPPTGESPQKVNSVPFKLSLLQSPAKRPQSPVKSSHTSHGSNDAQSGSPFKLSLLASPAKRPFSPVKPGTLPKRQGPEGFDRSPAPKATLLATPLPISSLSSEQEIKPAEEELEVALVVSEEHAVFESPSSLQFPGRLSAVLPRHADPALKDTLLGVSQIEETYTATEAVSEATCEAVVDLGDPMEVDEPDTGMKETLVSEDVSTEPRATSAFRLRQKDMGPYHGGDSESEDESSGTARRSAKSLFGIPATPYLSGNTRTPKSNGANSTIKRSRTSNLGFTPLADQLSSWRASSPLKTGYQAGNETAIEANGPDTVNLGRGDLSLIEDSPARSTYFDDEMSVRPDRDGPVDPSSALEQEFGDGMGTPIFEEITPTEEDAALATEANEMSLMEHDHLENPAHDQSYDDSISEASQEYGDENSIPVDPAILDTRRSLGVPAMTPQRRVNREFHTVSKVPLKPADDSTPRPVMRKRSHSISRLPMSTSRPTGGLTRSATVISYSPVKKERKRSSFEAALAEHQEEENNRAGSVPSETPTKSEAGWSNAGTPARTPRRDINPALLRGAVVFVDVHTSEGADASGIFVELLTQMGAKCVKTWTWNPSSPPPKEATASSGSKIGITHVVYKDGGKRTMEKVRESGGVVQCVGVSWVLDCERENQWLDEAAYYIDTDLVPRGGARRRKSMEPKALANLNGMMVATPVRGSHGGPARECHTAPSTPANRRDSGLWMRTPEDETSPQDRDAEGEDEDDAEWDMSGMLTPVPKTPAPETIARFAANVTPDTPSQFDEDDDDDELAATQEELMMRTCPPKRSKYQEMGSGILSPEKDQGVMMRLMAARRKSLQFAPKIGSPLARTWR